jgi:hypothetical protein
MISFRLISLFHNCQTFELFEWVQILQSINIVGMTCSSPRRISNLIL